FIAYPKCTTCIKAKKFLQNKNIDFSERHIVEENPTKEELSKWIKQSNLEIKKFFNTSGKLYKEMGLKDKLKVMTDEEKIDLLATNGMLVKRPILIQDNLVLVGFKEDEYNNL
ncbi:arsenate reductase family protein, partial [Clostridium saudiense]|nr:arsenate reductase family protein [Clostridium saudiense]